MQLPPPMKSFLKQYNLKGKTVVPFNTNAGYGVGGSFATVKELWRDSSVLEGFTTTGGIERDGDLSGDQRRTCQRSAVTGAGLVKKNKGAGLTAAYGECYEQKQRRRKRRN
jgi:hypothetical protein